jgi:hypothetical protein
VATLYESEAAQAKPGHACLAAWTDSVCVVLGGEGHAYADLDTPKNCNVRILRIKQQLGQWVHRLLKVHFLQ